MTANEIISELTLVRNYYPDRDGKPHTMNDAQWAVYIAGLTPFTVEQLRGATHRWMQESKWFPALSDLIALLRPKQDFEALALLAWATMERAIRRYGAYQTVQFENPAIGQTVQEVFGAWPIVCAHEIDSPAWGAKRKAFLAVFPVMLQRGNPNSPKLIGIARSEDVCLVKSNTIIASHETQKPQIESGPLSHEHSKALLSAVESRLEAKRASR